MRPRGYGSCRIASGGGRRGSGSGSGYASAGTSASVVGIVCNEGLHRISIARDYLPRIQTTRKRSERERERQKVAGWVRS
jgi:hypothetical protein